MWACENDKAMFATVTTILEYVVRNGVDLDLAETMNGCTPLQLAAGHNKMNFATLLLNLGANINGPQGRAGFTLHYALCSRNKAMVNLLLERGVRVDDSLPGRSILVSAIKMELGDLVPLLFEKGADIHQTGPVGESAVGAAYSIGRDDLTQFLLDHGARFLESDYDVLQHVISEQQPERLRRLLEYGINPNINGSHTCPLEVSLCTHTHTHTHISLYFVILDVIVLTMYWTTSSKPSPWGIRKLSGFSSSTALILTDQFPNFKVLLAIQ